MKKRTLMPTLFSLIFLISLLTAGSSLAQTVAVDYTWTAPTSGSAVDHYVVQLSVDGGEWTQIANVSTNVYQLEATYDHAHQIRVAAVDAESRQGIFSDPSDAVTPDAGVPSQPGKPIVI